MADGEVLQRFTPASIHVVQYAKEEARRAPGGRVGTEHVLVGLIREDEGLAARVLERLGVSLGRAQEEIRRQAKPGAPRQAEGRSWSPEARRVLEYALEEAGELNPRLGLPSFVNTEHLLLGLLREADSTAVQVLNALGAGRDSVRSEVMRLLEGERAVEEVRRALTGEEWVERAKALGAAEAKLIDPGSVITAPWVRLKCQYGCGGYGRCLTCPPYSPTPEETRAVLDCYRTALLVHCPGGGEWRAIREIVADLEREVFLAGHYKALAFGSGPCNLCEECALEDCLHPSRARPSMEAAGIDVYATARGNGYPIEVVTDRDCAQNYYRLVLIE